MSTLFHPTDNVDALAAGCWTERLRSVFAQIYRAATVRYDQYRTARSLSALDDRQLRDIGITRDQIDDVVAALRSPAASRR